MDYFCVPTSPSYCPPPIILPPPALLAHLYPSASSFSQQAVIPENEIPVIDLTAAPTPPIVLRDDMFDILEISQDEFLGSLNGWTPTSSMQLRH